MDRLDNGVMISPRVDKLEDGTYVVLVRRLTFVDGFVTAKEVLTEDCQWVLVPEGGKYPSECFISCSVTDQDKVNENDNWNKFARDFMNGNT